MSAGAHSQQFGRRRRSLSLGRYDDERFYDQSYDRDFYDGEDNNRFFGRRGFGGRYMNSFDDNCFDQRYGNRFSSRRRSYSLGRRNSMSRRYSVGFYDDNFNRGYSADYYRRPFGMNNFNHFEGNRFMNRYSDQPYFGYDKWYPGYGRFGYGRFAYNPPHYYGFGNKEYDYDHFDY